MERVTESFSLRAADGSTLEAVVRQQVIETTTFEDREPKHVDGAKEYSLADGRVLYCVDERTFEIANTGERLTRD